MPCACGNDEDVSGRKQEEIDRGSEPRLKNGAITRFAPPHRKGQQGEANQQCL